MTEFRDAFGVVVGANDYLHYPEAALPAVRYDAWGMYATLCDPGSCAFPVDNVRYLVGAQATAAKMREELQWLASQAADATLAVIYFSGHGLRWLNSGSSESCLVGHDAELDEGIGVLPGEELTELIASIRSKQLVVLLDCCYAGGTGELKSRGPMPGGLPLYNPTAAGLPETIYDALERSGTGRVILASSGPDQISEAPHGLKHSLFTHYLLRALTGEATASDGAIRAFEVFNFIAGNMSRRGAQRPVMKARTSANIALAAAPRAGSTYGPAGIERRRGVERRSDDERRKSSPLQRMWYGFWRCFHEATEEGKRDDFWRYLAMPGRIERWLSKEMSLYICVDDEGNTWDPQVVLRDAVRFVVEDIKGSGRPCANVVAIEAIASRIFDDMKEVRWWDRRSGKDRRQQASQVLRPQGRPAAAVGARS